MAKLVKFSQVIVLILTFIFAITGCIEVNKDNQKAEATIDKAKIEEIVRNYILRNPEIILQAVQNLQQKQVDEAHKSIEKTRNLAPKFSADIFAGKNDPFIGNPSGAITLVEFFDYQCKHCRAMVPVVAELVKANPDLRVIFKEFPIKGPVSEFAARAALVAQANGKYYEFHKAMMNAGEDVTQESVLKVLKSIGLDPDKIKAVMDSDTIKNQIKENIKLGQGLQLIGTPAFFVAKSDVVVTPSMIEFTPGRLELATLQEMVNKAKGAVPSPATTH